MKASSENTNPRHTSYQCNGLWWMYAACSCLRPGRSAHHRLSSNQKPKFWFDGAESFWKLVFHRSIYSKFTVCYKLIRTGSRWCAVPPVARRKSFTLLFIRTLCAALTIDWPHCTNHTTTTRVYKQTVWTIPNSLCLYTVYQIIVCCQDVLQVITLNFYMSTNRQFFIYLFGCYSFGKLSCDDVQIEYQFI